MFCPKCNRTQLKTYDSRKVEGENSVARKRQCLACQYKFKTVETITKYVTVERAPPKPKPPKTVIPKAKIEKLVENMRKIQERRERIDYEPWSEDNDYLGHL